MKTLYTFLLLSLFLNANSQDLKMGIVNSDSIIYSMEEFSYLDSVRMETLDKNQELLELMVSYLEEECQEAMKLMQYCISQIQLDQIQTKLQHIEQEVADYRKEMVESDSLFKLEIYDYSRNILTEYCIDYAKENNLNLILDEKAFLEFDDKHIITQDLKKKINSRNHLEIFSSEFKNKALIMRNKYDLYYQEYETLLENLIFLIF